MTRHGQAFAPAQRRNLVREWTRHHLPTGAEVIGTDEHGIYWNPPAPRTTTFLELWADVSKALHLTEKPPMMADKLAITGRRG